jgi:flagellar biosynthetic protein FliO
MEELRQAAAVVLVLGLLAFALWALRRRGFLPAGPMRRAGRRMQAIERLALSPRHSLHLVRVADHTLLIGVHPEGCTLLETLPAATAGEIGEAR